jgi:uroporphyrinogen III methyltransferase / synthase
MTPARTSAARKPAGRITFVGAGPGDPGLLTQRAVAAIGTADVVIADLGVALDTLPVGPGSVVAGEPVAVEIRTAVGEPTELAKAAVADAKAGRDVVRLVHGDPLTSAPVVKECQAVARTSVAFEIVPGVPIDSGVSGFAGVPVGPDRLILDARGAQSDSIDWAGAAAAPGTLVVTTTAAEVGKVAGTLLEHGVRGDTSTSVTSAGTTDRQRTVDTTLDTAERDTAELTGEVTVVIGAVTAKRGKLSWWESRALYGWRVLVPRTRDQAGAMSDRLQRHGAIPSEVPTIAVEPPRTPAQMERAIKGLVTGRYEWIVFTSVNAVRAVRERFEEFGLDARAYAGVKIACIGEATADAVRDFGIRPELVPTGDQSSEGLLEDFPPYDEVLDPINRILLPRADIATETLTAGLTAGGWEVDDVTAYRTVRAAPPAAETREAIKSGGFDAVCFTSSSTVRNLVGIAGKPHARTIVACIGPKTAETAAEFGLRVDVRPEDASVPALVDALAAYALDLREKGEASPPPRRRSTRKTSS